VRASRKIWSSASLAMGLCAEGLKFGSAMTAASS
jgi:hypothetical protein